MTLESQELECLPGTTLYHCTAGDPKGIPIILIHGWGADHRYFDFQLEVLKDFRLILPDIEGFGSSSTEKKPRSFSIKDQADKIHRLALSLGIEDAIIIGHSMGGMIALEIARTHPSFVRGLILEDTSPGLRRVRFTNTISALGFLLYGAPGPLRRFFALRWAISFEHSSPEAKGMITEYATISCCASLVRYVKAMRKWSFQSDVATMEIPTLILRGQEDRLLGADHTVLLETCFPESRTMILPECGHSPHLERPTLFNESILDFIGTLNGSVR
jgi:pimeloyl-ACP methyl ester carboxylesterase